MSEAGMVKVIQEEDRVETLWASPVSPGCYRLDNSPFYAYGVSWNDIVEAQPDPDGMLRMTKVVAKSGHRTIRVVFPKNEAGSIGAKAALQKLNDLGATYEGANPTYLAVDIPPSVELAPICEFLTGKRIQWEHADPTYEQLHGG